MEQRRFFLFLAVSLTIWMAWINFAVPVLFPDFLKPRKPDVGVNQALDKASDESPDEYSPADALRVENPRVPLVDAAVAGAPAIPGAPLFASHPERSILLGPEDPDKFPQAVAKEKVDEFFLAASLTSRGAAIDYVELTDKKRYPAFGHRSDRVRVLGSNHGTPLKTFSLNVPEIDQQLGGLTLDQISWEVVSEADPNSNERAATFRLTSPDGRWEITKHFDLRQLTLDDLKKPDYRDNLVDGYEVKLRISIRNLTDQPQKIGYTLQGPVGVPLEDAENTSKFRDLRMGFLRDDGGLDESKLSASEVVKKDKNQKTEIWKRKVKYVGVDVLYFAALVIPNVDQIDSVKAVVTNQNLAKSEYSDVSVRMSSETFVVPGKDSVSHEYTLFAGPKRKELVGQLSAIAVMDFGWFDAICRAMVWLLNTFHHLGLSYGIAIICLTALVRTLLMPISKHQAANAEKMKVLQPKMLAKQKELEAKYGKNTEEYMKAAQELSKEQLGLMMSGCLPVFLQLPIFIALYRAIGSSIELRMEPFLWFENLASPDALFQLPFAVPWFGWTHFNLLPCISTGLMFIHQKLTMPPPANEEAAQQQKMMGFMMIFMGAMFFRVPSGLCLYFIATNVWSMTERYIFQHWKKAPPTELETVEVVTPKTPSPSGSSGGSPSNEKPSVIKGLWDRLQEAADSQHTASRQLENNNPQRDDKKKKKR